ncbi:unnamed protein product [Strongylus vulgaris]|uniref:SOS1/NGEF-like PH domain-containing protein n=1 Tax=Strongylus vulgaris TaxID=40348 RepID=A0A3P7JL55_STRVU|nr:unnamed protein product [Strongylus vulgaris]
MLANICFILFKRNCISKDSFEVAEGDEPIKERYVFLFKNKIMITDKNDSTTPATYTHYATIRKIEEIRLKPKDLATSEYVRKAWLKDITEEQEAYGTILSQAFLDKYTVTTHVLHEDTIILKPNEPGLPEFSLKPKDLATSEYVRKAWLKDITEEQDAYGTILHSAAALSSKLRFRHKWLPDLNLNVFSGSTTITTCYRGDRMLLVLRKEGNKYSILAG